jgi:hypothetical protein
MIAGTRHQLDIAGHDVRLDFMFFSEREMTSKDHGWMVSIDGERRMGVHDTEPDALAHAVELIEDIQRGAA